MKNIEEPISVAQGVATRRRNRRGAAAREAILGATIACLHRKGYAGTTIEAVMVEVGLGRGSVLNQFPNRIALVAAAFARAMRVMIDLVNAQPEAGADPVEQLRRLAASVWRAYQLPAATAISEILLASRWDAQLAAAIGRDASLIEQEIDAMMDRIAEGTAIRAVDDLKIHTRSLIANFRGLGIELMLSRDSTMFERAIAAQLADHQRVCDLLLSGQSLHA